jgi:hypothetical protein
MTKITHAEFNAYVIKLISYANLTDQICFSALCVITKWDIRLAQAVYFAADSLKIRTDTLRRAANVLVQDKSARGSVDRIIKGADEAHKARNDLVHSSLIGPRKHGGHLRRRDMKNLHQPVHPISKHHLLERERKALDGLHLAMDCYSGLCWKLGAPDSLADL